MTNNFENIKAELKTTRNIYPLLSRLKGYTSPIFQVRQIITADDRRYKAVALTSRGVASGEREKIAEAREFLNLYKGSGLVPELVYADSDILVVEWIEGTVLDETGMSGPDWASLGRFIASSIREERRMSQEQLSEVLTKTFKDLVESDVLDSGLASSLSGLLSDRIAVPDEIPLAICFGDTNLKNFLRDENGSWRYIDVMGIYRAPVGRIFARQLVWIPAPFRTSFSSAYMEASPYPEIWEYLPFYYSIYLVHRIYVKTQPAGFLEWRHRRRRRKKARIARQKLINFTRAASRGEPLVDWIMKS